MSSDFPYPLRAPNRPCVPVCATSPPMRAQPISALPCALAPSYILRLGLRGYSLHPYRRSIVQTAI